jgi:hypothetical protein
MHGAWLVSLTTLTLASCTKPDASSGGAAPSASARPVPVAPHVTTSAAPAPPPTAVTWRGTYHSAPGSLYVYDGGEWKGVHFRGDDASVALGEGPLSLTVDEKTHVARGALSGPLGEAILTGAVTGDELTFTVLRKDPLDRGLTGTGAGKVSLATTEGTMRLSRSDAHVIREATFSLAKVGP